MTHRIYLSLWNKYRPAILKLMMTTAEGPQQYKFFAHEFKGLNPKEKDYSFVLKTLQGKAVSNIKNSATAQDLLEMLNNSSKAVELMTYHQFEFTLDKKFVFSVKRLTMSAEKETVTESGPPVEQESTNQQD